MDNILSNWRFPHLPYYQMIEEADRDHDGVVSRDDFYRVMRKVAIYTSVNFLYLLLMNQVVYSLTISHTHTRIA